MDKQITNNSQIQTLIKKEGATDSQYQSTFLPIFEQAETEIKRLIIWYFWTMGSKIELKLRIQGVIEKVSSSVPTDIMNRQAYIDGLYRKSNILIKNYYDKMVVKFGLVASLIASVMVKANERPIDISTPQKLQKAFNRKDITYSKIDIWSAGKGSVEIKDYSKKLKFFIKDMSDEVMTTSEEGKKPISLWQKAELDIRHNHQMEMLENLKEEGQDLCYISTHPNCSKRCEVWQGSLVSLTKRASSPQKSVESYDQIKKRSFQVDVVDGIPVYSLTDIMEVVDKYGYNNNIISGFNCRHKLIPYRKGMKPNKYTEKDVAKQRTIENNIRLMEREIRALKQRYQYYKMIGDSGNASFTKNVIDKKVLIYKQYCEKNGYAWYQYRINI